MIDKLLQRIAKRSAQPATDKAAQKTASSQPTTGISSNGGHDPFRLGYPLRASSREQRTGRTKPGADNPWLQAVDAYIQGRESGAPMPDQPAFFASWGAAHLSVAQLLWAEHDQPGSGWIHIYSADALLAVVMPRKRKVMLDTGAYQGHSAPLRMKLVDKDKHTPQMLQGFATYQLHTLLWFYGQAFSGAPDLLPDQVGTCLLQLRSFPHIEPAALDMRHLALIHVFSAGALSFAQLQQNIAPEFASSLCADVTSLYFTGTLQLLPGLETPSSSEPKRF